MSRWVVLQDFRSRVYSFESAQVIDDKDVPLQQLQAAGLVVIPYNARCDAALEAARTQRRINPKAEGDVSSYLLSRYRFPLFESVVFINSKDDFPAPVAGEIQLEPNTAYRINGIIDLGTDALRMAANTVIQGFTGSVRDRLLYSGTEALFHKTSSDFLIVRELGVIVPNGALFNIEASQSQLFVDLLFGQALRFGSIRANRSFFTTTRVYGLDEGMVFAGGGEILSMINVHLEHSPTPTSPLIDLNGAEWSQLIRFSELNLYPVGAQPAIAGDPANGNLGVDALGVVSDVYVPQPGIALGGGISIHDSQWLMQFIGQQSSTFIGQLVMSGNAIPTVAPTSFTLVAGATVLEVGNRVSMPSNNTLQFDCLTPAPLVISVSFETSGGAGEVHYSFALFKNGVQLGPVFGAQVVNKGNTFSFTTVDPDAEPGDQYDLRVRNDDSAADILVINETMFVIGIR